MVTQTCDRHQTENEQSVGQGGRRGDRGVSPADGHPAAHLHCEFVPLPALMVNRQLKESPTAPLDPVQPYSLNNPRCEPEISQRPEMQDLMHRPPEE